MPKCDFNKVAFLITRRYGCSPVTWLHIFRTPFPKNPSGGLLLKVPAYSSETNESFACVSMCGSFVSGFCETNSDCFHSIGKR